MADYETWMRRRNLSDRTITQWINVLERFTEWHGDPATATTAEIETWLYDEMSHLKPVSVDNYRKALSTWFRWLIREGHRSDDPTADVTRPKLPVYAADPIPTELLRMALAAGSPEMRVMICLGAYQGMRIDEMRKLEWGDIQPPELVVNGKGRRQRRVPLHPETAAALETYGHRAAGVVLPKSAPSNIAPYLRALGSTNRKPAHSLRAWFATEVYKTSGNNLLLTSQLLGHASTQHTAQYVSVEGDAAASAVAGLAA